MAARVPSLLYQRRPLKPRRLIGFEDIGLHFGGRALMRERYAGAAETRACEAGAVHGRVFP